MPYEIYMYGILLVAWTLLRVRQVERTKLLKLDILTAAGVSRVLLSIGHLVFDIEIEAWSIKLFFMFFCGAFFCVERGGCNLSFCFLDMPCGTVRLCSDQQTVVLCCGLAYIVFCMVYVPTGAIRRYNRLGDYSYGTYICAFPIQQTVAALIPGVSVPTMVILSTMATLLMVVLPWHLLEKAPSH